MKVGEIILISIPLRYNLEALSWSITEMPFAYFNSTKVQFGGRVNNEMDTHFLDFNSTKVQFGVSVEYLNTEVSFLISIPLMYNLEPDDEKDFFEEQLFQFH